jgi:hypothetical protein
MSRANPVKMLKSGFNVLLISSLDGCLLVVTPGLTTKWQEEYVQGVQHPPGFKSQQFKYNLYSTHRRTPSFQGSNPRVHIVQVLQRKWPSTVCLL